MNVPRTLICLLLPCALGAADLHLADGRTLQDYEVVSVKTGYMTVKHAKGIAQVRRELLPDEVAAEVPRVLSEEEMQALLDGWSRLVVTRKMRDEHRGASLAIRLWENGAKYYFEFGAYDVPFTAGSRLEFFPFPMVEMRAVIDACETYQEWSQEAMLSGVRTVSRRIAMIGDIELRLELTTRDGLTVAHLKAGTALLRDEDVARLLALLAQGREMFEEFRAEMDNAAGALNLGAAKK